ISNRSNKESLIADLMDNSKPMRPGFEPLEGKQAALFSKIELDKFIEEEAKHDIKILSSHTSQSLQTFSSGERKKALFGHLLKTKPEFLILDNPFDNLDVEAQEEFAEMFEDLSGRIPLVQLTGRRNDLLPFVQQFGILVNTSVRWYDSKEEFLKDLSDHKSPFNAQIPPPPEFPDYNEQYLIQLKEVDVSYGSKKVLDKINWNIKPGEFWELAGKNGSGKTTILSMITGDNPKGYGQELYLFGTKKGSGESIWDIKKKIGYFTPAMIDRFRGYHSLENMLISGLLDSIGLYVIPSEAQIRLARKWLALVNMEDLKDAYFHELTIGQQRLIMCVRAMIKHPLLLILDEPTAGLDDASAALIVSLVNKMAEESHTTIVFVSHRKEPGLQPAFIYRLRMGPDGSIGETKAKL
ncbi:MAG: ATP-binding cassette domain-containing protein, partial [Flavobacteriaceae bacterium]